ncbi:MAG: FtsL-like putative cell division protein [Bacteroidaceae bacterium]|nr:FtsL-like putative cell division protein [Bacteroidaceae bacterium]
MRENKQQQQETEKKPRLLSMLGNSMEDEMALKQWKSVIRQMSIDGQWFKKQIGVIILAVVGIIIYITCRYQAQQEIILEEQLKKELQDWKFRTLTRSSELTLKTRQSQIENALKNFGDSTLKVSTEAPYTTTVTRE